MIAIDLSCIDDYLKGHDIRLRRLRFAFAKRPIREILAEIQPSELAWKYHAMLDAHPEYKVVPGGAKHHHWWTGGLEDHVREMTGWMLDQKFLYRGDLESVSVTDIIVTTFLHDWDKTLIYERITPEERAKNPGKYHEKQEFRSKWDAFNKVDGYTKIWMEAAKFGITPTEDQWSAIMFHHGGFSPFHFDYIGRTYTGDKVFSKNPLAVLLAAADHYSSQVLGKSLV
jgi:hypothetical protein